MICKKVRHICTILRKIAKMERNEYRLTLYFLCGPNKTLYFCAVNLNIFIRIMVVKRFLFYASCQNLCSFLVVQILALYFCQSAIANSQNYRTIDLRNGLASMFVLTLHQDADGLIWAGTYNGVSLLGGNNSEVLFPDRSEIRELAGSCVENIMSTDDGQLWIQNNFGLHLWNRHTGVLEHHFEAQGGNHCAVSPKGDVVAFTSRGGFLYYNKVKHYFYPLALDRFSYYDCIYMSIDSVSRLTLFTHDERITYQLIEKEDGVVTAELWQREGHAVGRVSYAKRCDDHLFYIDEKGRVLMGDANGRNVRYCFTMCASQHDRGNVSSIILDGQDLLMSFYTGGIIRMRHQNDDSYIEEPQFFSCGVFEMLKDRRQDIIWVATDGEGVCYSVRSPHKIHNELYSDLPFTISKPVRAIIIDNNGDLWVGTKGDGLLCYSNYRPFAGGASAFKQYTHQNSNLLHNSVYCLEPSAHGGFWIGTDGNGVNYYDPQTRELKTLFVNVPQVNKIHDLIEIDGHDLYLCTSHGIYQIHVDWQGRTPIAVNVKRFLYNTPKDLRYFISVSREDQFLWFACRNNGFIRYDMTNGQASLFRFSPTPLTATNDAICVDVSQDKNVFCGTSSSAYQLSVSVDGEKKCKINLSERLDLQGEVIRALAVTPADTLWAATSHSIFCMDTRTHSYYEYNSNNGLDMMEFGEGACYYDHRSGVTYFGATNGFVAISPRMFVAQSFTPPILFYTVRVGNKYYDIMSLTDEDKPLTLRYNQNYFTVGFTAVDYAEANNYVFEYRLNEQKWIDNGPHRTISFVDMSPGDYKLQVRYKKGDFVSPVYTLYLRIQYPWWTSLPACIIYAILFLLLIWYMIHSYFRHLRLVHQQESENIEKRHREEIYHSRLHFIFNIANKFSTPLMLIEGSVQRLLAARPLQPHEQDYVRLIQENSKQMDSLIQRIIEFRNSESGRLLPLEQKSEENAIPLPAPPEPIDSTKPIVFVADENHEVLSLLVEVLQSDYNVFCFDTADSLTKTFSALHPNLIVAETIMSPIGGLELCRQLKADVATAHIPVILLSTDLDPQTRTDSATAGADVFLTKPFDLDYFFSIVRSLVQQRSQLKAYFNSSLSAFDLHDGRFLHDDDRLFMEKIVTIIRENISNVELSAPFIAKQMGVGLRNLYRRMQEITTETPTSMIREIRLEYVRQLLTKTELSMEEVCYRAGYNNRGTFYKQFAMKFGCTPKQYHDQMMQTVVRPSEENSEE